MPAPFGPADNGLVSYSLNGDLFVRDSLTGQSRLLFGGPGQEAFPSYSPDGQWLAYVSTRDSVDHFMVARADGTGSREIAQIPPAGPVKGSPKGAPVAGFHRRRTPSL